MKPRVMIIYFKMRDNITLLQTLNYSIQDSLIRAFMIILAAYTVYLYLIRIFDENKNKHLTVLLKINFYLIIKYFLD